MSSILNFFSRVWQAIRSLFYTQSPIQSEPIAYEYREIQPFDWSQLEIQTFSRPQPDFKFERLILKSFDDRIKDLQLRPDYEYKRWHSAHQPPAQLISPILESLRFDLRTDSFFSRQWDPMPETTEQKNKREAKEQAERRKERLSEHNKKLDSYKEASELRYGPFSKTTLETLINTIETLVEGSQRTLALYLFMDLYLLGLDLEGKQLLEEAGEKSREHNADSPAIFEPQTLDNLFKIRNILIENDIFNRDNMKAILDHGAMITEPGFLKMLEKLTTQSQRIECERILHEALSNNEGLSSNLHRETKVKTLLCMHRMHTNRLDHYNAGLICDLIGESGHSEPCYEGTRINRLEF